MRRVDTIAAIATARGQSALAVIRMSGEEAVKIAARVFAGRDLRDVPANTAVFGRVVARVEEGEGRRVQGAERKAKSETWPAGPRAKRAIPASEASHPREAEGRAVPARPKAAPPQSSLITHHSSFPLDQVIATVFRAPQSATGEDVVEISCHGGEVAARLVLQALLDAGARLADPGEFTQRAFLNDKLDLAQAEAVADLIHASSTAAHHVSVSHLEGRYSERLHGIREELLELAALVELDLDFSEEDVEFADKPRLKKLMRHARDYVDELLGSYGTGTMIRDGVRVVIAGRPNAGKSTLLNALVGRDRAIVTDTPGTTRDEIDTEAEIDGVRFVFTDTAGLRETKDTIEAEGVRRAEAAVDRADVVIYIYDITSGLDARENDWLRAVAASNPDKPVLVAANKSDLVARNDSADSSNSHVAISAINARRDIDALSSVTSWLRETVAARLSNQDASTVVTNERHRRHLEAASKALESASHTLSAGGSGDVLAIDLRAALQELGAITGAITNEDVLDQIFSRFCIGK